MINFSVSPVIINVQKVSKGLPSFKAGVSQADVFVKSSDIKKAWSYKTQVRNPIIRQEFEKHFLGDTHYPHDGRNGAWYIREEKDGPNSIYYASEKHPLKVREIRAFGKKGKLIKNAGSVAKLSKLNFDKNTNTYVAQPVKIKTKDGDKNLILHYDWIEEQAKMFLKSVQFEEIS